MAKWSLKNQQDNPEAPDMPPELSNYYREEKRDRLWGAWMLGFATLLVTIAIGVGLFMGGKWLVNRFTNDGEVEVGTPTVVQTDNENTAAGTSTGEETVTVNNSDNNKLSSNDSEVEPGGVVSDEAASTDLPDTGPGDTLMIFVAVTMLAAAGHSLATKKN